MRIATVEIEFCSQCPHKDDIGRCGLLDRGQKPPPYTMSHGVRKDCPLPKK